MWLGALFLTLFEAMLVDITVSDGLTRLPFGATILVSFWVLSLLLVVWSDVELVIDVLKWKRSAAVQGHAAVPADWVVFTVAFGISFFLLPGSILGLLANRRIGRIDNLLLQAVLGLVVTTFDVALLIDAVKMWRARRMDKNKTPALVR